MANMNFGVNLIPTSNDTYTLGDASHRWQTYGINPAVIASKTYTDVIASSNDNAGAAFFYLKIIPNNFTQSICRVKVRVTATVPGNYRYYTSSICEMYIVQSTVVRYTADNKIFSTSYRPIYYHTVCFTNNTGYNNDCGHWLCFNLINSTNPTSNSYKRTVVVELLDYQNCTVQLQDNLITLENLPNMTLHSDWYVSNLGNYDACSYGIRFTGDQNTSTINNLYYNTGNYIADSAIYRYQLLFQKEDDTLTPLNNNNNVTGTTKTILTNVVFNPFKNIFYWTTTTAKSAGDAVTAGYLCYSYANIDLRYTFNITDSTLTAHQYVYLKLTPVTNNTAKLASTDPLTQTLPSTADGYWYLLLGRAASGYQISLYPKHPIYYYDGTKVVEYTRIQDIHDHIFASATSSTGVNIGNITIDGTTTTFKVPTSATINTASPTTDIPNSQGVMNAIHKTVQFINGSVNNNAPTALLGTSSIDALTDGHIIYYRLPAALSASSFTIQLTFSNNTTSSAYTVYQSTGVASEADYAAGAIITLLYTNSNMYILSSNVVNGMGVSF